MKIYHLKACDTCRKAIKTLEQHGFELEKQDVRADGLSRSDIESLEQALGYEALVNKRSTTWRGLSESQKSSLNRETAILLLVENPTLMKRPVIEKDGAYTIGWTKDVQSQYGV